MSWGAVSIEANWCWTKSNSWVSGVSRTKPPGQAHDSLARLVPVRRVLAALGRAGGSLRLPRCRKAGLAIGVLGGGRCRTTSMCASCTEAMRAQVRTCRACILSLSKQVPAEGA